GPLAEAVLRHLLGLPDRAIPTGVPDHPEVWDEICGWYGFDPGPVTNLFMRAVFGAGIEVEVRRGHPVLRPLTPLPAMRRGLPLYAAADDDPYVFLIDLSDIGKGTLPVVFSRGPGAGIRNLVLGSDVLRRRPDVRNPRLLTIGALWAGATALAISRASRAARSRLTWP
ncbi:MAG TPA: serine hydrolase, partial [Actinomycetota bacterium]|nr:serine hydrolase [Actinomycetota bacterium]